MSECKGNIPVSEYPPNFLPKGAVTIEGYDPAAPEGDPACVVKGMYVDGEFHIQEVIYAMTEKVSNEL